MADAQTFMVAPSILSANFANLEHEISEVTRNGADWIHVDVMDGHFVPNLTIGAPVVKSLRAVSSLPLDVHLMIENPEKYVEDFARAGADSITVHVEAAEDSAALLKKIRELGARPGITLRPATPVEKILPFLEWADLVLVMTVNPGFGGQSFMRDQVAKITTLRQHITQSDFNTLIEVDGGINAETARFCRDADVLVAGSYIFKNNYGEAIRSLKDAKHD